VDSLYITPFSFLLLQLLILNIIKLYFLYLQQHLHYVNYHFLVKFVMKIFVLINFSWRKVVTDNIIKTHYTSIIHLSLSCDTRF